MIFPLLDSLSSDDEVLIRQTLASQLAGVATVCVKQGGEEGYASMCSVLLPVLTKLCGDQVGEVRIAGGESLASIASLIKRDELGARVLTIVLSLAHDDDHEDMRMTAAILLNQLAETLGPELCYQFVIPEIICLAEDPVFRVRKAAAQNLDSICLTAGPTMALKRIVPAFLRLTQDDIWGVRKACAESLVSVSKCLEPSVRVSELVPVFDSFAKDASKWVRTEALKHLGQFIATLPGQKVTPSLLAHYTKMGLPMDAQTSSPASSSTVAGGVLARTGSDPGDAELAVQCAFSLPAVVMTLGRARWPELRGLFHALSVDVQRKVRRPLAYALHEMARMLGPDIAEADLCPAMDLYLKDVEEVRQGALRGIGPFIAALPQAARERYAAELEELRRSAMPHAWRFRRILASQLSPLVPSFTTASLVNHLMPLAVSLLADSVWIVREEACAAVPALLRRLHSEDNDSYESFIDSLTALAQVRTYTSRVLFVHMARAVAQACPAHMVREHFAGRTAQLATDRVRNVRMQVARALAPLAQAYLDIEGQGTNIGVTDVANRLSELEDDVLPAWAREEVAEALRDGNPRALGRTHSALHALAQDGDAEVLRILPRAWVQAHRQEGGLDIDNMARQYVVVRAVPLAPATTRVNNDSTSGAAAQPQPQLNQSSVPGDQVAEPADSQASTSQAGAALSLQEEDEPGQVSDAVQEKG